MRLATDPSRVKLPASVELIATTSQARSGSAKVGMNGLSASTAGTLLTMLDRTAVKRDSRQTESRPSALRHCDPVRREQRLFRAGDDDEHAGEQDEQRPVELAVDPARLDLAREKQERAGDNRGLRGGDAGEEGDRERDAGDARLEDLALVHVAGKEMRLDLALEREFLRIDETHHDDDGDEAKDGDRRERGGEGRVRDPRQRPDHHVLRIAGDRRDAPAIRRGRNRER